MEAFHRYKCPYCGRPMLYDINVTDDVVYHCHVCKTTMSRKNQRLYFDDEKHMDSACLDLYSATATWSNKSLIDDEIDSTDTVIYNDAMANSTRQKLMTPKWRLVKYKGLIAYGVVERIFADQILRRTGDYDVYGLEPIEAFDLASLARYFVDKEVAEARYDYTVSNCVIEEYTSFADKRDITTAMCALFAPTVEEALQILTGYIVRVELPKNDFVCYMLAEASTGMLNYYGFISTKELCREALKCEHPADTVYTADTISEYNKLFRDKYLSWYKDLTPRFTVIPVYPEGLDSYKDARKLQLAFTYLCAASKIVKQERLTSTSAQKISQFATISSQGYIAAAVDSIRAKTQTK